MPIKAGAEFWRGIEPLSKVFKPDAQPELYVSDAPSDDERYYVKFTDTVYSRPLWISPSKNKWCDILMAKGPGMVSRHYHPHDIFAYTISGKWGYLEHDWIATAGDFVYEAPGEGHTLVVHEHPQPIKVFFVVQAPLIWLDNLGKAEGYFDVHDYLSMCREHYEKVGIPPDYLQSLLR